MRISERLLTVLGICLLVATAPVFAKGQGERELKQAQALVEEKQYAQAMTLLVQIMNDFPDLRDETDKLVALLMDVRRRFNEKYAELVVVLEQPSSEEKTAKGLAIIEELKALDPNPDVTVKRSLEIALQSLENAKVMEEFIAVMNAAAAHLAAGKPADAITTLRNGFTVGRELFDKATYASLLRDPALAVVTDIDRAAQEAAAGMPAVLALPAALDTVLAAAVTTAVREQFVKSLGPLALAADRESRLRTLGARISEIQSAIILSRGESGKPDFWLTLIAYYTLGRDGTASEGLAYAARQPWVTTVRKLSDTATAAAESAYAAMDGALARSAPLAEFRPLAEEARSRANLALSVLEREAPAYQIPGFVPRDEDSARVADLASIAGLLRQHIAEADSGEAFVVVRDQATATLADLERSLLAIQPSVSDAAALRDGRTSVATVRESAVSGTTAWTDRAGSAASGSVMAAQATAIRDGFASIATRALDRDVVLARDLAALEASGFAPRLADAEALRVQGRALATGTEVGQAGAGKRPDLGNEQYVRALADIGILLSDIDAWIGRWTAEPPYVSGSAGVAAELERASGIRASVVALQTAIATDATAARTAVALATQLRGTAETAYQAGQNEEKAKKFTDALASYTTARDSYEASLVQQENAGARARLAELPSIIERITTRSREQTLAEVVALIDRGVQQFRDTDFEAAIATLEAAGALWEAAAGGDNPTIEIYLDRATAALKVTGKQEITSTDPIYEIIRGPMTQAELSYNKAVSLQKTDAGSEEYLGAINSSRTSVQAITAVVPEYREARLLALKIDRLQLGTEKFAAELRKRVDEALASSRSSQAGEIVLRDAYFSLKDYKALEGIESILTAAKRREIDTAIANLEVALGLRPRPIPAADVAASRTLYQQALTEYRRNVNDGVLWESALFLLQQSLARNPENKEAQTLRDQVVVKRGTLVDVLSTAELASYRTALGDFTNKNFAIAEARVDELMRAKPRNPLLLDLKRRIQATR